MSRIVDVEPLDCLAWKDGEHGTTFDDGVLWVLEKIGELPTIERKTDEWCSDCKEYDAEKHCCPRFNRVIRQTLSEQTEWNNHTVEPERKKGKWLSDTFDEWYCCSVCHKGLTMFDGTYDFCPHCGADMRGDSE